MNEAAKATEVSAPEAPTPERVSEPATRRAPLEEAAEGETRAADEWRKVRELALKQLDRFMALEPKVLRGDDPDAIHDIRVASRRLQQVLDLIYPPPPPGPIRKLRRKIQRTRRALGEVRNCDVQLARVEKTLSSKRVSRREAWEAVRHYLRQRRASNFGDSVRKLSKLNLAVFYVRLKEYLASDDSVPHSGRAGHLVGCPPEELLPAKVYERLGQSLDRVWQAFDSQIELSHRDRRAPVLHGARIAAKRTRYLIEVIREFDVPGSSESLSWLRGLQQHLGDWHDEEVLEQMMAEMLARPDFLRSHLELAMDAVKLIQRNRARKRAFENKYLALTGDSADYHRVREWVDYVRSSPSAAFATA